MSISQEVIQAIEDIIHFQRDAEALRKLIIEQSIQKSLSSNFLNGYSPLTSAIMWNAPSIVKLLTQEFNVDVTFPDKWGRTPLRHAAVYKRQEILVHLLMVVYARTCKDATVAEYIDFCLGNTTTDDCTNYENKDGTHEFCQRNFHTMDEDDDDAEEDVEGSAEDQRSIQIVGLNGISRLDKSRMETESKDAHDRCGRAARQERVIAVREQDTIDPDGDLRSLSPLSIRGGADYFANNGFVRWFERSFWIRRGNAWDSYLMKCVEHGFDSLRFWSDIIKLNEIGHRNQEKFQLKNILTDLIGMQNERHASMFMKQIQKELYSRSLLGWLSSDVGLAQYLELFLENGFADMEDLMDEEFTDDLLLEMGVESPAHRFRLLMHISLVQGTGSRPPSVRDVMEAVDVDVDVPVGGFNHRSLGTVY